MKDENFLSWKNVVGYGLGDMANNFVFTMGALFLLTYYTDVAGISAASTGVLLALIRLYSALTDIIAGRIIDQTSTRWGRFRPFLLWGALPLLLLNVSVFSVPSNWSTSEKLVYAYITYSLLVTAYSFVNISYGSLAAVITQTSRDRTRLAASRTFMSVVPGVLLAIMIGKAIHSFTGAALQNALTTIMLTLATLGALMYFLCFAYTSEVVVRNYERHQLKECIGTLFRNFPLWVLCASVMSMLAGAFSMSASIMYFARYILGDVNFFSVIIGTTTILGTIISIAITPVLVIHTGKKNTCLLGLFTALFGYLALFFSVELGKVWILISFSIVSVGNMVAGITTWALISDTMEYGEWLSGIRSEGFTYSVFSCVRKCGQALGGSIPAFMLANSGYMPNAPTQIETARHSIVHATTIIPAVAFMLALILMVLYPLTDRKHAELVKEINARNSG